MLDVQLGQCRHNLLCFQTYGDNALKQLQQLVRVAHGFDGPVVGVVDDAAERLNEWFQGLGESAIVVYDFKADWDLLALAMQGHETNRPMNQYAAALQLNNSTITHPEFEKAQQAAFSAD
jgi:hypothetical protein